MRQLKPATITYQSLLLLVGLFIFSCKPANQEVELKKGMRITESVKIKPGEYLLTGADSLDQPAIIIEGNNIVLDFNGAVLDGGRAGSLPDAYSGLGVLVKGGENIQIKNAVIKGYKVGLMAVGVDSLQILDSDFSYNWRPRLKSNPEWEVLSDWLSYHHNDDDQWLRYGTAIYLKKCDRALVKNVTSHHGQNGLLLAECNDGFFYNNNFSFNSGLGIGLYRSNHNHVMHNRADWCIRGYSHGIYNRGQDSAGILAYEQSSDNTFAYNSATHSGDGFFLWAGQTTMDSGEGGCNGNLIYKNDFSHASNNGVEITFSSNQVIGNRLEDCHYGVWAGYSHHTTIAGNHFKNNSHDVAFEHGNTNTIYANKMEEGDIGIQLWERPVQPKDWGFAQKRDVSSRDYTIDNNLFLNVKQPLKIESTRDAKLRLNQFFRFQNLLKAAAPNERFTFVKNSIYQNDLLGDAYIYRNDNAILNGMQFVDLNPANFIEKYKVEPLSDGMSTDLPSDQLRGRQYMLITEWGPYNFKYPSIWLRAIDDDQYTFALFGPAGNWKIVGGNGFTSFSRKTGAMPATVVATKAADVDGLLKIELEFIGESFIDVLGGEQEKGRSFAFGYEEHRGE